MCSGEEESRQSTAYKGQGDCVNGNAGLFQKNETYKAKKLKNKGSAGSCWSAEHFI